MMQAFEITLRVIRNYILMAQRGCIFSLGFILYKVASKEGPPSSNGVWAYF